jgi:hypothetical protein
MKTIILLMACSILSGFSPKVTNEVIEKVTQLKAVDDIYVSFDYMTDKDGYNYGAVFYLYNPNDYTMNVQWQFVGSENVRFGPSNSDRTTLPGKTKLWITTCTVIDNTKAWNSGKVQWKY